MPAFLCVKKGEGWQAQCHSLQKFNIDSSGSILHTV